MHMMRIFAGSDIVNTWLNSYTHTFILCRCRHAYKLPRTNIRLAIWQSLLELFHDAKKSQCVSFVYYKFMCWQKDASETVQILYEEK